MATTMDNFLMEETMKRRLLLDGETAGDDRKILSLLKAYVQFCVNAKNMSKEQRSVAHRRILSQLHQVSVSFLRTKEMIRVNEETKEMFTGLGQALRDEVVETKGHIEKSKKLLEDATKHRRNAMEYDALAKLIVSQPDRKATEERKTQLAQELESLKVIEAALNMKLHARRQNLLMLAGTIERLKQLVNNVDDPCAKGDTQALAPLPMEVEDGIIDPISEDIEAKTSTPTPMELDTVSPSTKEEKEPKDKLHEDLSESEGEQT